MAATLHDVATLAGVSIKTVSNVVNDYQHISPSTREKVLAAIAELGYTPNISARSLRSGREIAMLSSPRLQLLDGLIFSPLGMSADDVDLLNVSYPLVCSVSGSSAGRPTT